MGHQCCIVIDQFIEEHAGFSGERELFAIHGMANQRYEKYQSYAAAYCNDIVTVMKLVRPKLKELLMKNSADPTALILYALTGMYLKLPPNEAREMEHILLTLLQFEQMGIDVSGCKELWGQIAYTQEFESN